MNGNSPNDYWDQLRSEARTFAWKGVALRMLADIIAVNAAMITAFVLWYLFYAVVLRSPKAPALAGDFRDFITIYWMFWSLVALLIFHLSGVYTRTRGYTRRYKALVVLRAVTLFMVVFVFADYLLFRGELLPRGVALLGWLILLALIGGPRMAIGLFLRRYNVEPKRRSRKVERVLVVGGAGYLGSVLVRQLLARGYKTRVLDTFLFGRKPLEEVENHPDCELLQGDIRDIQAVVQATKGTHAVVHLAGIVGDPACNENQPLALETNRAATRMLIDVARGYGVERFLFASTCSVYGASDFLVDEQTEIAPISLYAETKADSEKLLLTAKTPAFHPTALRLATLFGCSPRPRFDLVVNLLCMRAVTQGKITIYNGEQWRPLMHVYDAARAFVMALEADVNVVSGEVFNVGSYGMNHRLSDIANAVARSALAVNIEYVENADRRNYRVSFDKIHTRLGFVCHWTLEGGIQEIVAMVRASQIRDFSSEIFNNLAMVKVYTRSDGANHSSLRLLEALAHGEPTF